MKTLLFSIIVIMLLISISGVIHVSAQYGCTPISGGWHPVIISKEKNVYLFWNYFHNCGKSPIFFVTSTNNGLTFSRPTMLTDESTSNSAPAVTAKGDNVYMAWIQYDTPSRIFFRSSIDDGKSFGDTVSISNGNTIQNDIQKILVNADNIGIIWTGIPQQGVRSIFLSESFDGGKSFGKPVLLSSTTGDSFLPKVIQVENKAFVIWSSFGDCDSGRHVCSQYSYFTTITLDKFSIGSVTNLGRIEMPDIAVSDNRIYIDGVDTGNNGLIFLRSTDNGISFENPVNLVTYASGSNHINDLALDATLNHVYVTWYNFHSPETGADIEMISSSDGGNTFENRQKIVSDDQNLNGNYGVLDRSVSASSDNYYSVWLSHTSLDGANQGMFFRKSIDGGKIFGDTMDMTTKTGIYNPEQIIDSSGNFVYVAGPSSLFKDENNMIFSRSTDGGNTFRNAIDLIQNVTFAVPTHSINDTTRELQITSIVDSPLKQFKSGIKAEDVKCNQGLQLIFKIVDYSPRCVKPDTASKLVERGWALTRLSISGLKETYSVGEKIGFIIDFQGVLRYCDHPDVSFIDSNQNMVWKSQDVSTMCTPPPYHPFLSDIDQKFDLNSGYGGPIIINKTGNYTMKVSLDGSNVEQGFTVK